MGNKKKVFVGISGGVDSSVAAALLKEEGYDITSVFIKVWQPDFGPCPWKEDRLSAMQVAAALNVPFVELDLGEEYKRDVVDYMIREYKAGRTPNPDVFCNRYIKFGAFLTYAKENGADFIATGHYARIRSQHDTNIRMNANNTNEYELCTGVDKEKDQSYFLWTLIQEQLRRTLFPIGGYEKSEVRTLARKFGLPTAERKDSQGLCFVGKVDMREFLQHFIKTERGEVLNEEGSVIGSHNGAELYTIGQRHGFTIAARSPKEAPYYVIGKDIENNTLVVSTNPNGAETAHDKKKVLLKDINWIGEKPLLEKRYQGRCRYRQELEPCRIIKLADNEAIIEFEKEQAILPEGQSCVLYDGEVCLGGGILEYVRA